MSFLKSLRKKKDSNPPDAQPVSHVDAKASRMSISSLSFFNSFNSDSNSISSRRDSVSSSLSATSSTLSSNQPPLSLQLDLNESTTHPALSKTAIVSLAPLATRLQGTITINNRNHSPLTVAKLVLILLSGQGKLKDVKEIKDPESPAGTDIHARPLGRQLVTVWNAKQIPPGSHVVEFTLPFPKSLPPTAHLEDPKDKYGVTHFLFASVKGVQSKVPIHVEYIQVFARRKSNRIEPVDRVVDGISEEGSIKYAATFPYPAYYSEAPTPCEFSVYPPADTGISRLTASWFQVYIFRNAEQDIVKSYREQVGQTYLLNCDACPVSVPWPTVETQPASDAVPLFTVHHEIKFNIEYKRISGDTASSSSTTISVPIKLQIPHDRPIDSRSLNNNHNSGEPVIPPVTEKRGQRRNVRLSIFSKPSVTGAPIIQQGCMTQEANPPVAAPVLEQVRAAHTPNLVAATTFREQDYSTQSVSRFPAMTVERHRGAERLDSLPATSVASQRYNAAPASAYSVDQLSSVNRTHPAGAPSAATGQAAYTTPVSHHSPVAPSTSSTQTDEWAHRQGKALFDYIPRQPDELRIRQGDVISIIEAWDDGWGFGHSLDALTQGVFPLAILDRTMEAVRPTEALESNRTREATIHHSHTLQSLPLRREEPRREAPPPSLRDTHPARSLTDRRPQPQIPRRGVTMRTDMHHPVPNVPLAATYDKSPYQSSFGTGYFPPNPTLSTSKDIAAPHVPSTSTTTTVPVPTTQSELDAQLAQNLISGAEYLKRRDKIKELEQLDQMLEGGMVEGRDYLLMRRRILGA